MRIQSNEFEIIGNWIYKTDTIVEDETSKRINFLKEHYLEKIAVSDSGWEILYRDPEDGRYWELIYRESESHGGGAPSLINIGKDLAYKKYKLL